MRPTPLSLTLLFSWLLLSTAQDAEQSQVDALSSSLERPWQASNKKQGFITVEGDTNGDDNVREARKILNRLRPLSDTPAPHSRRKGFLGSIFDQARTAFYLLCFGRPTHLHFTASTVTPRPVVTPHHDLNRAMRLLGHAAVNHQHPDAIWLIAELNFHGNFTHPRNYSTAYDYYDWLAKINGNASAQHMLGFMFATGIGGGMEQDQARALLYHTFAADQGDTRSQMTVAYRHHAGIGTPRNCELAVKYYREVAKKAVAFYKSGPPGGHVLTRNAYRIADEKGGYYGEGASVVSAGPNAKQGGPNSDAYAKLEDVLDYLDLQSRKGKLQASFNLAKLLYDGSRGLERDLVQARGLFSKIARTLWNADGTIKKEVSADTAKLAPRAAGFLGRMFLRGEATKVSYSSALKWFKRGMEYDDVLSQYSMGVMYMQGLGVAKDPIKAASYLSVAADSNMAVAQTDLGVLFLDQGDVETARAYFELATTNGHIEAYYYIAEIAEKGLGRERSCGIAASAYKIAAEMAEVVSASFIEANEAYETGDTQRALTGYMMAAEQGYENAQANVAWLLDKTQPRFGLPVLLSKIIPFIKLRTTTARDAALSLIYYTRSARQRNWDSLVKAGDYYISGLGQRLNNTPVEPLATSFQPSSPHEPISSPPAASLLAPNPENAAACYQAAAEHMKSAQAMWNLGWMHETGTGVEQDFHLAKRYYDLALATDKEAYLGVTLSLYKLRLRSWWSERYGGGGVRPIGPEETEPAPAQGFWDFVRRFLDADAERQEEEEEEWAAQRAQERRERGQEEDEPEYEGEGEDAVIESLAIVGLAVLLGGLVWWRQVRVQRGQQGVQRVWPAPDDPDFAPWNVGAGGVGH